MISPELRAHARDIADVRFVDRRCGRCDGSGCDFGPMLRNPSAWRDLDPDWCPACGGHGVICVALLPAGATRRLGARIAAALAARDPKGPADARCR